ncbi:MAG: sigma-54-dependent Fis family transcriptional regulator, partial [bacterium]|nr:sigma-54-dependent Fis family transcriptional regulator [bacterium]
GSNRSIPLDVRLMAATNRDLEDAVSQGGFREDLYYRLKVVTLDVPPLRERRDDIGELARFVLRRSATRLKLPTPTLSDEAIRCLESANWPGNVRELEHVIERAVVLSRGGVIGPLDLEASTKPRSASFDEIPLDDGFHAAVAKLEQHLVERALAESSGNKTRAAELLKINRRLLYDKMKEFGLE